MDWFLWLVTWTVVSAISPGMKKRERYGNGTSINYLLIIGFALMGLLAGTFSLLACVANAYMIWLLLVVKLFFLLIDVFATEGSGIIKIGSVLIMTLLLGLGLYIGIMGGLNNAVYFDQFIKTREGMPFESEIPDNLVRLTTKELAVSIAKQHSGEFGSNIQILDTHITMYGGRLVWVNTIGSTNTMAENYVLGMIIVDANNPNYPPVIIGERFEVADGLWFTSEIHLRSYLSDTAYVYGKAYPTIDNEGNWVYVLAYFEPGLDVVRRFAGVMVFDTDGEVVARYGRNDIPKWITQPFDEDSFLEGGINDWGSYKRGIGFDFWAGGFLWIKPSNDRLAMSEDTRYIYDPDLQDIVAITMVHPIGMEESLAGMFKTTRNGITFYDLRKYNLISGERAVQWVEGKLGKPTSGTFYATMPLLYPLKISNKTRFVWYIPLYWTNEEHDVIRLEGFAIVDAQISDYYVINKIEKGITGDALVSKTRRDFVVLFGEDVDTEDGEPVISGTLVDKDTYIDSGYTCYWLTIKTDNGEIDVWASAEYLSREDMRILLDKEIGDSITVETKKSEGIFLVTKILG